MFSCFFRRYIMTIERHCCCYIFIIMIKFICLMQIHQTVPFQVQVQNIIFLIFSLFYILFFLFPQDTSKRKRNQHSTEIPLIILYSFSPSKNRSNRLFIYLYRYFCRYIYNFTIIVENFSKFILFKINWKSTHN